VATNVFQNTALVANEFQLQLTNRLAFIKGCNHDYASRFNENMKTGESIKVRKPPVYKTRSGETFTAQNIEDQYCTMSVQQTKGVDLEITSREQMFNFTSLRDQVIIPAAHALACDIELAAMELATLATYNFVGTPGTVPTSLETYNDARAIIFDASGPVEQERLIITSAMGVKTSTAGQSLFNPSQIITDSFKKGFIGRHAMAEVYESQVVKTLTTGPFGGTPAIDGAGQTGSTIATKGWTAAAANRLKAGDIISFAGVYSVNRWTKQSTGRLANFVVTEDFDSDATGKGNVHISPALVVTGNYQNVTGSPADSALISIYGTAAAGQAAIANKSTPQGLRFARNAFLFASFDQPLGEGGVVSNMATPDPESSVRVRFMKAFDISGNVQRYRFDVVWAFGVAWPELACRIAS
jgi:hypothetical protein